MRRSCVVMHDAAPFFIGIFSNRYSANSAFLHFCNPVKGKFTFSRELPFLYFSLSYEYPFKNTVLTCSISLSNRLRWGHPVLSPC